jgi:hypothetical protein
MGTSGGLGKILVMISKSQLKVHNKQWKQLFGDECSKFFYERKQAKLQWVEDMGHISGVICTV